ncbi:TonB-dependent receptor [Acinetobacter sp. ANC 4558]|uniref:TonB-dependent receptor family protein n=1 Tax=Acinetobacter sp. ANC 4558 TaxID=1977876 RepID=UPI000A32F820|nr:TonB-dependent receptor [Acinetobacter sp. ANC 4558]OTG86165.1 TonB-dependent receptor [Acinetobacter sp. ANC 4558]
MENKLSQFNRKVLVVMIAFASTGAISAAEIKSSDKEEDVIQLDTILITAEKKSSLQAAKQALGKVAGGTNLVSAAQFEKGKSGTAEEIFALQPGIYAKSPGNEGAKVSIRGSGVNRAPGAHASGIHVLLDDIPFTGPGGTPYELLEPLWISRADVLRGANGFDVGSLALGGAVNYVTKTGRDAERLQLRYEVGSRGFQKYALSSGQQIDKLDYYVSINGSTYNGYQVHGSGDSKGIAANVGYQITPDLETRFYLRYRETEHETPGRLTKKQIKDDPRAANPFNLQYDAQRTQPGSTWVANKTTLSLDSGGKIQASFAYHHYPMDLKESLYRTDVKYSDVTASLSYSQPYELFGLNSVAKTSIRSTTHRPNSGVKETLRFNANGYDAGTVTRRYTYRGSDNVIQLSNDSELKENLWLTLGVAGVYTKRESEVYYPVTGEKLSEDKWDFAPRIGLRYEVNPELHLYSNLSKSVEPPHPWSLIWGSNKYFPQGSGPAAGRHRAPIHLDNQEAQTFEFGGRGEFVLGSWDASYYYSKVKNELLLVEISPMPNLVVAESNASRTIHQGVELGLHSLLFSHDSWGDLSLRQSYTYSDFRYKDDPVFGKNQLPGLPKHFYQAQLRMDFYSGWFASLNTEYASKVAVDYANTFYADAFNIWGLSIGYQPESKKWNTWIDFKNIGDKHYASTISPGYNDKGQDVARSSPGEGFSTYAGISINF